MYNMHTYMEGRIETLKELTNLKYFRLIGKQFKNSLIEKVWLT